jgi:hypothetical protein
MLVIYLSIKEVSYEIDSFIYSNAGPQECAVGYVRQACCARAERQAAAA